MPDDARQRIWGLVRQIPKGKVATYGDIAAQVDCNPRLVGWALRQAAPAQRLPWHRVLAAGGRIALPGVNGEDQRLRLKAEGVTFSGRRVRLAAHRYDGW